MDPSAVKRVEHGGDLAAARRRHPAAPEPWLDLSTGINPVAYPLPAVTGEAWSRLPGRDREDALLAAAARRYGLPDHSRIVAAPGTQALIQTLPRLIERSRVAIVGPTYEEHEICWRRQGHLVETVPALSAAAGADIVVLVNPDNPTGHLTPVEALPAPETLLVVDEAFIDLLPRRASLVPALPPRTVVLRSFGKTYGLAGVRLGFAIAEPSLAERLRAELGPWAISGPALEIGRVALEDDAWLQQTASRLAEECARLDVLLEEAGFTLRGGTPLFRLAEHEAADRIADRLGDHGIHVRRFRRLPGCLRFGIPTGAENFDRLRFALHGRKT